MENNSFKVVNLTFLFICNAAAAINAENFPFFMICRYTPNGKIYWLQHD